MGKATTVAEYLAELPPDRRHALSAVRDVVLKNLPDGFEEGIQFGMLSYHVPLSRYPDTYNGQALGLAALASQKSHMALYLTSVYGDPALRAWFEEAYAASGKKLDMGKSCVRFKSLEALPLDVIGQAIARVGVDALIATHEKARSTLATSKPAPQKPLGRQPTSKKPSPPQPTSKKPPTPQATSKKPSR